MNQTASVAPGQLYVFLSEGTLVVASSTGKPTLGTWSYVDSSLTMVEEGIPYKVDILKLTQDEFVIRSHNPGEPVEMQLVPADLGPVGSTRTESSGFQVLPASAGRLSVTGHRGMLHFIPCEKIKSRGKAIAPILRDLPDSSGTAIIKSFGSTSVVIRWGDGQVREIRFAGPGEINCDHLLSSGELEAKGNEPFWAALVDRGEVVVRTPENQEGVHYGNGSWSHPAPERWRYEAKRGVESLTLEITETLCLDSMSGARYPFKAVLIRGGGRMEGCALEGRRAMAGS